MIKNNYLDDMLLNSSSKSIPLEKQDPTTKMELLTIKQIFEQFPEVRTKFRWTKEDLEVLLDSNLLTGKIEKEEVFISKLSLQKLIEYRNNVK
jgi:hypothetical protein